MKCGDLFKTERIKKSVVGLKIQVKNGNLNFYDCPKQCLRQFSLGICFSLTRSFTADVTQNPSNQDSSVFDLRLLQSYLDFQAQVPGFFWFCFSSNVNKTNRCLYMYICYIFFVWICVFAICHFKRGPCFWTY